MKSKVKFESFDLKNEKVKNPDQAQQKNLSKTMIKKLVNKEGETTNFHLILNYFKDEAGKILGHFLDVGENKKLTKHFEQVEMKSGKLEKSMSAFPKEAASGKIYVKKVKGQSLVHVEPDPSCKIPGGKWGKLLKELKAQFGGLKAVVVFEGKPVLTEEEQEEETTNELSVQRQAQLKKMQQGVQQMDQSVGKAPKVKLEANIAKYEAALKKLIQEANADNHVDEQEQAEIDALQAAIEALRQNVTENGSQLTPERLSKVQENITTMETEIEAMLAEFDD